MPKLQNPKRSFVDLSLTKGKKALTIQGAMPVVPEGMKFKPDRPYTYCCICGELFQPELDRVPSNEYTPEVILAAEIQRRAWSHRHAKNHKAHEHRSLALSGRHCTPEALIRLVPFGIIPITDIVLDDESRFAGLEAPRAPNDDVETTGGL